MPEGPRSLFGCVVEFSSFDARGRVAGCGGVGPVPVRLRRRLGPGVARLFSGRQFTARRRFTSQRYRDGAVRLQRGLGRRFVICRGFIDVARLADAVGRGRWFRRCRSSIRADADHRTNHNCANNKKTGQIRQELPIPTSRPDARPQLHQLELFCDAGVAAHDFATEELGLDMKSSALFSALPFATMAVGSLVSGQASAALLQRMSPFEVRKIMVALSSIVPACSLLALSYVKSPATALGLLVTALGAHSFSSAGLHAHVTDVAPTASGRILGFTNTVGVLVGIVANVATGRVLDATGSFKAVFALTAAIYLSA